MDPNRHHALRACSIGAGPMGRALLRSCAGAGITPSGAWARTGASRRSIARSLGIDEPDSLETLVADSDIAFVAVPEHAIADVLDELAAIGARVPLYVTSGSCRIDELERACPSLHLARLHPLRAVADGHGAVGLAGCTAAVTASDPDRRQSARELATRLGMSPFDLADDDAATWHAAAVLAAGSTVALFDMAVRLAVAAGLDEAAARAGLGDLAHGALARARDVGPALAMTGPVPRVEPEVLVDHRAAVADAAADAADAWAAITRYAIERSRAAGRIDDQAAAQLLDAIAAEVTT